MPLIVFIDPDGGRHEVQAPAGRSLMQAAVDNDVPGILGDCGGACSCATCHGYVDPRWADRLPPLSESEAFMLDEVIDRRPGSRLCCQIPMAEALDGIVVQVAAEQP